MFKRNKKVLVIMLFIIIMLPALACGDDTKREKSPIRWHRRKLSHLEIKPAETVCDSHIFID